MSLALLFIALAQAAEPVQCFTLGDLRNAECRERCRAEYHQDGLFSRGQCYCSLQALRLELPHKAKSQRDSWRENLDTSSP